MCTKILNLCVLRECFTLLRTLHYYLCWKICCMLTAYTSVVLFWGPWGFRNIWHVVVLMDLICLFLFVHMLAVFLCNALPFLIWFFLFIWFFLSACTCCHPLRTHSSRKQSSWRESVTGSIPQLPSTPKPSLLRCKLTSTLQTGPSPRQQMGPSPHQHLASTSHLPQWHPPRRATAATTGHRLQGRPTGKSRRSRKNKGPFMRTLIQRTVLITACLKTNRPKQIKPLQQQQHRVRLIYFTVMVLDDSLN